jgi:hypothetical protein
MNRQPIPKAPAQPPRTFSATSPDGAVAFKVAQLAGAIHVERTCVRTGGQRIVQSVRFVDPEAFIHWCEADPLKFAYPLLYDNLKRGGCALFPAA